MDFSQMNDAYIVYMHLNGRETTKIVALFRSRENAEAYVQEMKCDSKTYIIERIITDF